MPGLLAAYLQAMIAHSKWGIARDKTGDVVKVYGAYDILFWINEKGPYERSQMRNNVIVSRELPVTRQAM